ncbi:MAG: DUF4912 domain-containing protein [Candidatus Omnitrophica bacterium]|nr:DUF4912 domain-containing protein [Candidatus Omnitrophota bacterium]
MRRVLSKVKQGIKNKIKTATLKKTAFKKVSQAKKPGVIKLRLPVAGRKLKLFATVRKLKRAPVAGRKSILNKIPLEVIIGESKFHTSVKEEKRASQPRFDLPQGYFKDKIVLQVRDPWWIHSYWEVTDATLRRLEKEFSAILNGNSKRILRAYDISNIIFDGKNAHRFFDIGITPESTNWYINTQAPGRSWCVDIGLLLDDGRFITIARSNTVSTPLDGPSWITDEEWMIPEDMFVRLYGMGAGMGSSPLKIKELYKRRLEETISSGALSSVSSPGKIKRAKGFWLKVGTDLIVYGQTEPDAKVTVAGRSIKLRPDGSFSLRFSLPDGKQVIPVKATSSDGEQSRKITPIVSKETK